MSNETWALVKQNQEARGKQDLQQELALRKSVKQRSRKDKKTVDEQRFQELQGSKEGWADIKSKRKPFVPNHSKLEDRQGHRVQYVTKSSSHRGLSGERTMGKTRTETKRKTSTNPGATG